jgi:hypothetical protein
MENFRRATQLTETPAPVVLWIDKLVRAYVD